jgi:outer membrane protein assembly factor BamB
MTMNHVIDTLSRAALTLPLLFAFTLPAIAHGEDFAQWRGPRGDGISTAKGLPTKWGVDLNVAWKTPLPEPGNSTPVVWGDRIFVTQPVANENRRTLLCLDRTDGKTLWQQGTDWTGPDPTHGTNPFCSASPVTDGKRVIVWHGSAGLFAYDLDGRELWRRDLGIQKHIWGYGSSPVIHGDLCFLNFGPGPRSFLIAVRCDTGETVWQHDEPINTQGTAEAKFASADFYGSWSTPVIRQLAGQEQLVISFPFRVCGFEPSTGKLLWSHEGINALVYTSPLIEQETIVSMGGYSGMTVALRVGPNNVIERLWRHPKTKQRIGSGAIHDGHIFIHNDPGIAECFDLKTGESVWEERLVGPGAKATNWSSVMIADGNCYTINQAGDCFVFRASPKFELIATNSLGETSNASIVTAGNSLLIRTHQHLWSIAETKK